MTEPQNYWSIQRILYQIQQMNQEERELLILRLNLSSEEQLLNFFSEPIVPIEDFTSFRIHKYLLLYVPPIMILIGTIGHILSFTVFRTNSGKVSTYTYLSALAVMDLLVLYVGLFPLWIAQLSDFDMKDQANWTCKLVVFLGYVCSDSSVWLIVAVTVERYIAACYPLQASKLCRIRKARYIVFVPILALCFVNCHFLWTVQLQHEGNNNINPVYICDAGPNFSDFVKDVWVWVDAAMYSFLPFAILLILNVRIIQKVWIANNKRKHFLTTERSGISFHKGKNPSRTGEVSKKLTMMLLVISFTFLLTTLPMNIILIATKTWNEQNQQQRADFFLAKTVSELLMYLNHSINFFLYCISGRKFRCQIYSLLCKCIHSPTKAYSYE